MKKNYILIAGIAIIGVIIYLFAKGKIAIPSAITSLFNSDAAAPVDVANANGTAAIKQNTTNTVAKDSRGFPLRYGSTGTYVKLMQGALNKYYGSSLVQDGIWGPKTDKALKIAGFGDLVYYKQYFEITRTSSINNTAAAVTTPQNYDSFN